jgi:hypothetical protein
MVSLCLASLCLHTRYVATGTTSVTITRAAASPPRAACLAGPSDALVRPDSGDLVVVLGFSSLEMEEKRDISASNLLKQIDLL